MQAEIVSSRYCKAIIKSEAALSRDLSSQEGARQDDAEHS